MVTVLPALESLIVLQELDTAAEGGRRRLAELPAAEQAIDRQITAASANVDRGKATLAANQQSRRELEKQVAAVDTRLARFDDHKAAVKTNQEYTALLHEIATAKSEKDAVEEQILGLMESADGISAEITELNRLLAEAQRKGAEAKADIARERSAVEAELTRLGGLRGTKTGDVDKATLAKYEQLLKQRKMVAVARMQADICSACHVRLRPAVTQQVRRNDQILTCDSCQRILYFVPEPAAPDAEPAAST